jgi:hypothetical protein
MPKIVVPPGRGSKHRSAKLTERFVVAMRRSARAMGYYPVAQMARAHRVTYWALRDALTGETYAHVNRIARPFLGPTRKPAVGSVVRIDSETTHGWQARRPDGKSKLFSDSKHGRRGRARAKAWLLRKG